MKTSSQKYIQERYELHLKLSEQTEAMLQWRDGQRDDDLADAFYMDELAKRIRPLLEYFSRAQTERTLGMRAWCLLYAVTPDLIDNESINDAALRFHVSQEALCYQLKLFREQTSFNYESRVGRSSTEQTRERAKRVSISNALRAVRFRNRKVSDF